LIETLFKNIFKNNTWNGSQVNNQMSLWHLLVFTVYRIQCNDCSQIYIGETGRPFKIRLLKHKRSITSFKFLSCDRSFTCHEFGFERSRVIILQSHWKKRKIAEALRIQSTQTVSGRNVNRAGPSAGRSGLGLAFLFAGWPGGPGRKIS
jgi:hypothetical protein